MRGLLGGVLCSIFILYGYVHIYSYSFMQKLKAAAVIAEARGKKAINHEIKKLESPAAVSENNKQPASRTNGNANNQTTSSYDMSMPKNPFGPRLSLNMPKNPFGPKLSLRDQNNPFNPQPAAAPAPTSNAGNSDAQSEQAVQNIQNSASKMSLPSGINAFKGYVNLLEKQMQD